MSQALAAQALSFHNSLTFEHPCMLLCEPKLCSCANSDCFHILTASEQWAPHAASASQVQNNLLSSRNTRKQVRHSVFDNVNATWVPCTCCDMCTASCANLQLLQCRHTGSCPAAAQQRCIPTACTLEEAQAKPEW